jgi:hypothetical protein
MGENSLNLVTLSRIEMKFLLSVALLRRKIGWYTYVRWNLHIATCMNNTLIR